MVNTTGHQGSHIFSSFSLGNCFIVLERERGHVEAGEWVEVEPFSHLFGAVMTVELSDEEMLRYNRQIVLRGFDFDGRERLKPLACWWSASAGSAAPPRSIWPPPGSGSSPCSISTLSRSPTCSARRCTATPPSASRRWIPPARRWRALTPRPSGPAQCLAG